MAAPLVLAMPTLLGDLLGTHKHQPADTFASVSRPLQTQRYPDGLVISTRFMLQRQGRETVFAEELIATNARASNLIVDFQQPVPRLVLTRLAVATFIPSPPTIIDHGAGLVWPLKLPAHGQYIVDFQVTVPGLGVSVVRLQDFEDNLTSVPWGPVKMNAHRVNLESITIEPAALKIGAGHSVRTKLVGRLSNGKFATSTNLSPVHWATTNRQVATVNAFGRVTAIRPGVAKLIARVRNVSTFIFVTVPSSFSFTFTPASTHAPSPNNPSRTPAPTNSPTKPSGVQTTSPPPFP